jgi:predicted ATPase
MSNIFINRINIKNFRCFEDEPIELNIPDGSTSGSGLNILIGENGTGKTTVLESIDYLTQSSFSAENKLKIGDFNDYENEIVIKADTTEYSCKLTFPYRGYFECNGIEFKAKSRKQKARGKLLSPPFQVSNHFACINTNYKDEMGKDSGKPIPDLNKMYSNSSIIDDEVNIFFFDKNRTRQISTGTYKTTFEKICDDLNWRFRKNIDSDDISNLVENICGNYFENVISIAQKGVGKNISKQMKEFFQDDLYDNLRIDLLELLNPFDSSFYSIRNDDELKQLKIRQLGSGIEIILTLILLKIIANESKGSVIYLIDEPELHLHPKAQEKLINLLIEESANKQIILSTHSPYIYKNCLSKEIGLFVFNKNANGGLTISTADNKTWGLFPWSPSWGEINYYAFELPTVEFHNELYGYIHETSTHSTIMDFDNYLSMNSIAKSKQWIKENNGIPHNSVDVTLCTFIRNYIHHPENTSNSPYTDIELKQSIESLINVLRPTE